LYNQKDINKGQEESIPGKQGKGVTSTRNFFCVRQLPYFWLQEKMKGKKAQKKGLARYH